MFQVGERVRYWNPEYAEHNSTGTVAIADYNSKGYYWILLDAWRFPVDAEDWELVSLYGDRVRASVTRRVRAWREKGGAL